MKYYMDLQSEHTTQTLDKLHPITMLIQTKV